MQFRFVSKVLAVQGRSCDERVFFTVSLCDNSYSRPEQVTSVERLEGITLLRARPNSTVLTKFVNVIDFLAFSLSGKIQLLPYFYVIAPPVLIGTEFPRQ